MSIIIKDRGVLAALLDEAEEYIRAFKSSDDEKALNFQAERSAKFLNQLTEKVSELIDEKTADSFTLNFSVSLPRRYIDITEKLEILNKKVNAALKEKACEK